MRISLGYSAGVWIQYAIGQSTQGGGILIQTSFTSSDIKARVNKIIIQSFDLAPDSPVLTGEKSLFGSGLGIDSLDALFVTAAIEDEFQITIDDADITSDNLASVSSITHLINQKLNGGLSKPQADL